MPDNRPKNVRVAAAIARLDLRVLAENLNLDIAIRYLKDGPRGPLRTVNVQALGCERGKFQTVTHIIGWDRDKDAPRFFLTERIWELVYLETGETTNKVEEWLAYRFGIRPLPMER